MAVSQRPDADVIARLANQANRVLSERKLRKRVRLRREDGALIVVVSPLVDTHSANNLHLSDHLRRIDVSHSVQRKA